MKFQKIRLALIASVMVSGVLHAATPNPPVLACTTDCVESPTPGTGSYELGELPSFVQDIQWPAVPQTTAVRNVSNMSDLQSAVRESNILINVAPGTYLGDLSITGSDVDIVVSESATIVGQISFGSRQRPSRIRWTGGNMEGGPLRLDIVDDLLIDNFHGVSNGINNFSGGPEGWNRVAIINSTIEVRGGSSSGDWSVYVQDTNASGNPIPHVDFILANVKLISDAQNNRFQHIENMVVVDSAFNPDLASANGSRFHSQVTDLYVRDSTIGGSILVNGTASSLAIINGHFDNVTRYRDDNDLFFHLFNGVENVVIENCDSYTTSAGSYGNEAVIAEAMGSNNIIRNWNGVLPNFDQVGARR